MGATNGSGHDPLWTRVAWLLPAALLAAVVAAPHTPVHVAWSWVPSLGIEASFHFDGLNRLFLLLITGIGTLVFFYAPGYLHGHRDLGRLMALLTAFMLAMIGAVSADGMLMLFVFWEATSVLSFLLVGFGHDRKEGRDSALQALLVTGAGGLALLAGILLMQTAAPGLRLSDLPGLDPALRDDPRFIFGVLLVVVGCMTKSAQFPFHFWLPGAMAAPTPVSAYLHSATMVKLGIYLLARFDEAMGGVEAWSTGLVVIGTVTSVWAAVQALRERDLKRILAWSTVAALGTMTLLIGLPNERGALALSAFVLAHAMYKAALFFVAGNIDHATGTRIIDRLRGLRRAMPFTAAAAAIAAVSMAGLPLTFGFVAKEAIGTAKKMSDTLWFVGGASLFVSAIGVAVAGVAAIRIFSGPPNDDTGKHAHDGGLRLILPPLLPALGGIVLGFRPAFIEPLLLESARMIAPALRAIDINLHTDWRAQLGGVALILALGTTFYVTWDHLHRALERLRWLERVGPASHYDRGLSALKLSASFLTRTLQNGRLGSYVVVTAAAAIVAVLPWLLRVPIAVPPLASGEDAAGVLVGCAVIVAGAALAAVARDTLQRLLGAGAVGFGSAIVFLFRGAPDLAFTQLAVETVFVVVAAVALSRYRPLRSAQTGVPVRLAVAVAFGLLLTTLMIAVASRPLDPTLASYFLENSVPKAHGHNVVNVIIVDFRGLDTLGEISVVMLTALAAWPLIKGRRPR
jgi:multicomponent Na+:H+ antiporter subunit A